MSHSSSQSLRNRRGQFATPRNPLDNYLIVQDVARLAAKRNDDPLKDPAMVTEPEWNDARHFRTSKWGDIKKAAEICVLLRDPAGTSYPWRQLLATVFTDPINFAQHHAQRMSEPDREISDEHAFWAANQVASSLRQSTLRKNEYEAGRKQLLERPGTSQRARLAITKVLPTANQLTTHCGGSWDRVLEVAKLEFRTTAPPRERDALPVSEAVAFFFLANGYLPSWSQLHAFARREGIAVKDSKGISWGAWCADATRIIEKPAEHRTITPALTTGDDLLSLTDAERAAVHGRSWASGRLHCRPAASSGAEGNGQLVLAPLAVADLEGSTDTALMPVMHGVPGGSSMRKFRSRRREVPRAVPRLPDPGRARRCTRRRCRVSARIRGAGLRLVVGRDDSVRVCRLVHRRRRL
jgi:hypothetical protein